MTLKQEREYISRIHTAKEAEKAWDRRNESGELDGMDDEVWHKEMSAVTHAVYLAEMAYFDAKIKTIRPNDWYKKFLESFGNPPENPEESISKSVTQKQALKLMEKGESISNCRESFFRYNGKVYSIKTYKYGGYSLTIRMQFC